MLPLITRDRVLSTLAGTPSVLEVLTAGLASDDARWDHRPDVDRFTLREIVAHLADMEPIWSERLTRICQESEPILPNRDESQMALDHNYAHSDPSASLARFRDARAGTIWILRALSADQWERQGIVWGSMPMTLETLVVQIAGHDGYHTGQIAEWVSVPTAARQAAALVPPNLDHHARQWIEAWNRRDLAAILEFYSDDCDFVAPSVTTRWGRSDGRVRGKAELSRQFSIGLERAPDLHMELRGVLRGVGSAAIFYVRESGSLVADVVTFDGNGLYRSVTVLLDKPYD